MAGVVSCPPNQFPLISRRRSKAGRQPLRHLPPKFPSALPAFLHSSCTPKRLCSPLIPKASVGSAEYIVEPVTNVKFARELSVPGMLGLITFTWHSESLKTLVAYLGVNVEGVQGVRCFMVILEGSTRNLVLPSIGTTAKRGAQPESSKFLNAAKFGGSTKNLVLSFVRTSTKSGAQPESSRFLNITNYGYREKVFAIIGVKVYAAGFYAKHSIRECLDMWKGKSAAEVLEDSSLFSSIFQAPVEKSLQIMLVRDVDGKTFWNALNEVISPRIKEPTAVDESGLSTFRNTFQGRDLKQGTLIFLTWAEPSKMLVSISSDGFPSNVDAKIESVNVTLALFYAFFGDSPKKVLVSISSDGFPSNVDAKIESVNVTLALFDAFFGDSPVSPTLKASVANGLIVVLN